MIKAFEIILCMYLKTISPDVPRWKHIGKYGIRGETREKALRSLTFSPVSKLHTHITYMLRQCTSIVYIKTISPDVPRCGRSLHLYALFITDQYQKKYWAGYIGREMLSLQNES
jgi:hypothetical protein